MTSPNDAEIFFSVIIPTRNRPIDFLVALKSVLEQDYSEFEVIIVNDGTNETHRQAYDDLEKEYISEKVSFINLMQRERGHGHCFARNQGVDAAKGNFICFLDDDDYWTDKEFLSRAANSIVKNKADFYFANQQAVDSLGNNIDDVWVERLTDTLPHNDPRRNQTVYSVSVEELLKATGFPHQNCWAVSKELFLEAGGMDECLRYEPDRDIFLRVIDSAKHILYDKTYVAIHNVPDKTKSNNASTKTNRLEKLLFQKRTNDKGILFAQNKSIVNFCKTRNGYVLKQIAEELALQKKNAIAYYYAKEALLVAFSFKWLGYTFYLRLASLLRGS